MKGLINVLDLFAGCWWLSEWFFNENYNIVWHIEMDYFACETIKTRILYHKLKEKGTLSEYVQYLKWKANKEDLIKKYNLEDDIDSVINDTISNETYESLAKKIKEKLNGEDLHLIIGGPPCQSYSNIWRSRDKNRMEWDSRNYLYLQYIKFLEEFRPKIFIFENVPGLLSAWKKQYFNDMKQKIEALGYSIEWSEKVIDMSKHWLPQNRKRVIIVWRHKNLWETEYIKLPTWTFSYKVKDILKDLPVLIPGEENKVVKYEWVSKAAESLWLRTKALNFTTDHTTRPHRQEDLEIYRIAVNNYFQWKLTKYNELPKRLQFHKNTKSFLDRFKVVKGDENSTHTVVAHISKDGHYYIYPSKEQIRSLSVREAARIQTFPDDFKFEWPRTAQYKQIGNAVPPHFSKLLSSQIVEYFNL